MKAKVLGMQDFELIYCKEAGSKLSLLLSNGIRVYQELSNHLYTMQAYFDYANWEAGMKKLPLSL